MLNVASAAVDVEHEKADILVLLVGADHRMRELVGGALARSDSTVAAIAVDEEAEGLAFLETRVRDGGRRVPDLVLLAVDPDAPLTSTFFEGMQRQALLDLLPLCVLATTLDDSTKRALYEQGANAIVEKMDTLDGVSDVLNPVVEFWCTLARRAYIE